MPRRITELTVLRTEQLTPHFVRITFGGPGFDGYQHNEYTDRYVKLLIPAPGVVYPQPFDLEAIQRDLPAEQRPTVRSYTIRSYDPHARELVIDFVVHGHEGYAGPWAVSARPGDLLRLMGPGGDYAPSAEADWHLLAGDEAALPAIAAALEAMPPGAQVRVFLQVEDAAEEQKFETAADVELTWLHRDGDSSSPADLVDAIAGWTFPAGRGQVFVHGDAGFAMPVKKQLKQRGIEPELLSVSGYWRSGRTDEQWRAEKKDLRARGEL